ncbi:hypothetical protein JCM17846_24550 [Iodidimonas nitroreducens]|uniref:Thiamine pyrophosphate enzyme N-terminal TPP-binding domain-containing protein n=1 Tax=Iodidimonas nitroreducens TaxID=1236968 RepID=A0A5A7N8V2_9PROT|nr:thiamine pyrophosphate-binding protein [Iodidimonas nitroreducens]GER04773.1 hypothetical protein JCM17846_24550 [Iodidimonas nitroreducens]
MMRDQNHDNLGVQDKLDLPVETTAEALLAVMKARGIDYLFANPGTDFPAIIEAYARAPQSGLSLPQPILVPHENAAVSMAHGYYLGSGRMQAAMVHVSVGLANSLCALLNAARENVPIFFGAGRTPITESGSASSAMCRSIGVRKCMIRPGCCAKRWFGIMNCAPARRWTRWWIGPWRWPQAIRAGRFI